MKIQVISDTHLEFYKEINQQNIILPNCDYLFLAGDICKIGHINYTKFLQYCSDNWTKTFVVLGNHEYYNSRKTYDVLLSKYRELFELFDNVFLLEKDILELDDWVIVGCTLWSHIVNKQLDVVNCTHQIKKIWFQTKIIERFLLVLIPIINGVLKVKNG